MGSLQSPILQIRKPNICQEETQWQTATFSQSTEDQQSHFR